MIRLQINAFSYIGKLIIFIISLAHIFFLELHAQSMPVRRVDALYKDSICVVSSKWRNLKQDVLYSSPSLQHKSIDSEITELTNQLLSIERNVINCRPYELRIDFPEELIGLLDESYTQYLCPGPLKALLKPQPFTYNMSKAGYNGYMIGIDCWVVIDVPEFHVSDYKLEIGTDWFWAEDWR